MASKRCKQCKTKHEEQFEIIDGEEVSIGFGMKSTPSNLGLFCDFNCIADWVKENPVKVKSNYKKAVTRERREFNVNDKKVRAKAAKTACHKYIRERDRFKGCISCESVLDGTKYDAGHLIESGNYPFIRFDENNIFGQCVACNQHKGGNEALAKEGAIKRIGEEAVQWLYDNKNLTIKRTVEDYREIEEYFKDKLSQL